MAIHLVLLVVVALLLKIVSNLLLKLAKNNLRHRRLRVFFLDPHLSELQRERINYNVPCHFFNRKIDLKCSIDAIQVFRLYFGAFDIIVGGDKK